MESSLRSPMKYAIGTMKTKSLLRLDKIVSLIKKMTVTLHRDVMFPNGKKEKHPLNVPELKSALLYVEQDI